MTIFELPDTMAALPRRPFEAGAVGVEEAGRLVRSGPAEVFRRLLRDQESEGVLLAARYVLDAFLGSVAAVEGAGPGSGSADSVPAEADAIAALVAESRVELATAVAALDDQPGDVRDAVLRQRAPLAFLGGSWLDVLSQPATQPSIIVNKLFVQYYALHGAGNDLRSVWRVRRRRWEDEGIQLPEIGAADFLTAARARPLTVLHGCFYLALARMPANFLPELLGMHYVVHALGLDEMLFHTTPFLPEAGLREVLGDYLALAGDAERARLLTGVRLGLALEREHAGLLTELAAWEAGRSLEARVAEIVARHAPLAGNQHRDVRVGGRKLADTFSEADLDVAAFLHAFRESPALRRPASGGDSRFIHAVKFGGPMFGIFDDREAAVFKAWVESVQSGARPEIVLDADTVGREAADRWSAALALAAPDDVVVAEPVARDDRELFHRLVNIENFPNSFPLAAEYAEGVLAAGEVLFERGAEGRYTDATWFDYSPAALYERAERVYWDKLIAPYQPLESIPDRDEVVFLQTTYALGALIDGTWLHRLANLGHDNRPSDPMLRSIYADEMGHGDLRKNHLTLIHTALASMDVRLPHIRDDEFLEQAELPDELYGFSLYQLSLALFPDRFYNEILGYNLAIEMFGLGELRLHEIQKLRHHGFDDCYEQAHLTIDNISAGHTKQAADIIVAYLDHVARTVGVGAVAGEWRRVWRGYAAYAYVVEHELRKRFAAEAAESVEAEPEPELSEMLI